MTLRLLRVATSFTETIQLESRDTPSVTMATDGANGVKEAPEKIYLIWGGEGWVAGHLKELLQQQKQKVSTTTVRMENRESVMAELERVKPTHVLNCAGCTGRPNVDWCEDNKEQVIRSNVIGTLNLTDCCFLRNIHCTVFATGCTFCLQVAVTVADRDNC